VDLISSRAIASSNPSASAQSIIAFSERTDRSRKVPARSVDRTVEYLCMPHGHGSSRYWSPRESIYPRRPALRAVVWSCARTRIEGSCQRSPDRTLVAFRVVLHRRRASKLIRRPRALAIEATEPAPSSARTAYIVRFDGALRRRPLPSVHPWIHNNNSAHPDPSELSAAR